MPDGANHVAFAYSKDGRDRFMTVYPNLNLLDGTKDFSGNWANAGSWQNDGTYEGLTVKKTTTQWNGINKTFTAPKDGNYTFSAYVKGSGGKSNMYRYVSINGGGSNTLVKDKKLDDTFGWLRDSFTVNLKAGDTVNPKYEINAPNAGTTLWTAGHKWEAGPIATPWMPSFSEATASDYPSYIGTYTDNDSNTQSTDPGKYTWKKIVE